MIHLMIKINIQMDDHRQTLDLAANHQIGIIQNRQMAHQINPIQHLVGREPLLINVKTHTGSPRLVNRDLPLVSQVLPQVLRLVFPQVLSLVLLQVLLLVFPLVNQVQHSIHQATFQASRVKQELFQANQALQMQ